MMKNGTSANNPISFQPDISAHYLVAAVHRRKS